MKLTTMTSKFVAELWPGELIRRPMGSFLVVAIVKSRVVKLPPIQGCGPRKFQFYQLLLVNEEGEIYRPEWREDLSAEVIDLS